jgi:hypothetical protein
MDNISQRGGARFFGAGDVLAICGLALNVIMFIILLVGVISAWDRWEYRFNQAGAVWVVFELLTLAAGLAISGAALALSFKSDTWLYVLAGWGVFVVLGNCFTVQPFVDGGMRFFWLLGGLMICCGARLSRLRATVSLPLGPPPTESPR